VTKAEVKEIHMPALSSTMTEGKIVSWLKGEAGWMLVDPRTRFVVARPSEGVCLRSDCGVSSVQRSRVLASMTLMRGRGRLKGRERGRCGV
jgi:hypothetical protein